MKKFLMAVMICLLAISATITNLCAVETMRKDMSAVGWLTIPLDHPENMAWGNTSEQSSYNQKLISMDVRGHIGDRDYGEIFGKDYALQEANLVEPSPSINWSAWRIFLYDYSTNNFTMLNIKTHKDSVSFGNATFTFLTSPNDKKCIVVTYFLFSQGAGIDEAGELIFYKEIEGENLTTRELIEVFENVTNASAYRYNSEDDQNCRLDTIKIIDNPEGGYLGVYHSLVNQDFQVRLATSTDMLNWMFTRTIENSASQLTIAEAPNGAYIVAFEEHLPNERHLKFHYYPNLQSLLTGIGYSEQSAELMLGKKTKLEGTPNIYNVTINDSEMLVCVGFHYNCLKEICNSIPVLIAIVIIATLIIALIILIIILIIKIRDKKKHVGDEDDDIQ